MTDTTTTKRGRPATGRARTPAQRSADLRARARTQVFEGSPTPLGEVAASVLLEGIATAYRARLPFEVERIAGELVRRLSVAATEIESVAETVIPEPLTVAETNKGEARGYPAAVQRMALGMADRGDKPADVRAAIMAACGKAPSRQNFGKSLRRWREGDTARNRRRGRDRGPGAGQGAALPGCEKPQAILKAGTKAGTKRRTRNAKLATARLTGETTRLMFRLTATSR